MGSLLDWTLNINSVDVYKCCIWQPGYSTDITIFDLGIVFLWLVFLLNRTHDPCLKSNFANKHNANKGWLYVFLVVSVATLLGRFFSGRAGRCYSLQSYAVRWPSSNRRSASFIVNNEERRQVWKDVPFQALNPTWHPEPEDFCQLQFAVAQTKVTKQALVQLYHTDSLVQVSELEYYFSLLSVTNWSPYSFASKDLCKTTMCLYR